jgi:hypothetical protein
MVRGITGPKRTQLIGKAVVPAKARDFLDEIDFETYVATP